MRSFLTTGHSYFQLHRCRRRGGRLVANFLIPSQRTELKRLQYYGLKNAKYYAGAIRRWPIIGLYRQKAAEHYRLSIHGRRTNKARQTAKLRVALCTK